MKNVFGGQFIRDCRDSLQEEAAIFQEQVHTCEESDKFFDEWAERWEDCLRSLGINV